MKTTIIGTEYIKGATVMAWMAEANEIIAKYPRLGEEKLRIEHSFTRTGYKVSYITINKLLAEKVANYPHTSFAKRPEIIELVHRITKSLDNGVDYENRKTVEVIRLSDGAHFMETPEVAKTAVEEFKVAKYA